MYLRSFINHCVICHRSRVTTWHETQKPWKCLGKQRNYDEKQMTRVAQCGICESAKGNDISFFNFSSIRPLLEIDDTSRVLPTAFSLRNWMHAEKVDAANTYNKFIFPATIRSCQSFQTMLEPTAKCRPRNSSERQQGWYKHMCFEYAEE